MNSISYETMEEIEKKLEDYASGLNKNYGLICNIIIPCNYEKPIIKRLSFLENIKDLSCIECVEYGSPSKKITLTKILEKIGEIYKEDIKNNSEEAEEKLEKNIKLFVNTKQPLTKDDNRENIVKFLYENGLTDQELKKNEISINNQVKGFSEEGKPKFLKINGEYIW